MSQLTEKRAADREKLAQMVEALCVEMGAKVERSEYHGPREIRLEIEIGEACVGLDFDGDSTQPDVYCMPWNTLSRSTARMTPAFGRAVGAEVNPYHRAKCTGFAYGIDDLLLRLRRAMECISSGEAFER